MAEFKMAAVIKLSQIELVWVRVRVERECFWVNLREDNKVSESKMAVSESNMAEFKMAAIIKLSQNEWVKVFCAKWLETNEWAEVFLCKMVGTIIKLSKCEWVWVRIELSLSLSFVQDGRIQDGRIQDGCHHQVKWEWMSLSQIELVWVRVRVEWECFWVNLREDNKVSESKMAVSESNMAEFKMAAIIKLSQNEGVKFFLCKMADSKMAEFKMVAIIKLSENEWVWVRLN